MTEIRTKDRIFLAVAVPAVVAALYWFGWREGEWRRIGELRQRQSALVSQEDFDDEMARANRQARAAREELAAERNASPPARKVKGDAGESEAERGRAVVETLRAAGLKIVRSEASDCASAARSAPDSDGSQVDGRRRVPRADVRAGRLRLRRVRGCARLGVDRAAVAGSSHRSVLRRFSQ